MDWSLFLKHLEKNKTSPVLVSLLKKTTFISYNGKVCIIQCQNTGIQLFLKTKHKDVQNLISEYLKNPSIEVVFIIGEESKRESKKTSLPLIEYSVEIEEVIRKAGVSPRFKFDNFAVSSTNQIAHAAAITVAENPGKTYNPLFLYGGVGVGKTHLSQAIANKIIKDDVKKHVLFCTSEDFTNDLIELIRKKNTSALRKKYRKIDLLIVDDVQFIAGKNYVQEEFYHTFNSLVGMGSQIILTSDRPPVEIEKLEARLRSRFSGGLTIDVQDPDFELRTAILLIKARERNIPIDINVAKYIAQEILDTRELEGTLLRLFAKVSATNGIIDQNFIEAEFGREKNLSNIKKPTIQETIRVVCLFYNIRPSLIRGPSRKELVAKARQIVMYILRTRLHLKYEEIAFILKKKDHTTIMYGVDKITTLSIKDVVFKKEIDKITNSLNI